MITINHWSDLERYGVDLLTGEACALGYRGLFDLTPEGLELVRSVIGAVTLKAHGDRNGEPATGSLLMPYTLFEPLAVFALFQVDHCKHVCVIHQADTYSGVRVIGFSAEERERYKVDELARGMGSFRILTYPEQRAGVTQGMSNINQIGGFSN